MNSIFHSNKHANKFALNVLINHLFSCISLGFNFLMGMKLRFLCLFSRAFFSCRDFPSARVASVLVRRIANVSNFAEMKTWELFHLRAVSRRHKHLSDALHRLSSQLRERFCADDIVRTRRGRRLLNQIIKLSEVTQWIMRIAFTTPSFSRILWIYWIIASKIVKKCGLNACDTPWFFRFRFPAIKAPVVRKE